MYFVVLQEEVDDVLMMTMDEILAQAESGNVNFTPDSIYACQEYVKLKGLPTAIGERPSVQFL
jgi:hypothetical protein